MDAFLSKIRKLYQRKPTLFRLAVFLILLPWILRVIYIFIPFDFSWIYYVVLLMVLGGGLAKIGNLLREEWRKIDE